MTYLPQPIVIDEAKITQYLLVPLAKDDKSKFLARGGYGQESWQRLRADLMAQALNQSAEFLVTTPYGDKYQIRGALPGVNGVCLNVLSVWMVGNQQTRFITLVPDKL
ncbi:DUF6883 domain-containing protein [Prochlorothrix hollandica]|uniref:DUF6883 domain-containing protein n=1 Tax=Prochlorothrix hollandica PCC 9006 = CALU 1027 TaxID=317619 RepID=A0A0M2PZH1_PROHO|nr:DUF6883 domain-containing protein [Prochlorothrix hollandica]KKJ00104.1 hypothetical protein PROH_10210 [Prochlorothrix hollandica PCC 9006 = CALU 1027]